MQVLRGRRPEAISEFIEETAFYWNRQKALKNKNASLL
jgi:hypothetical protein